MGRGVTLEVAGSSAGTVPGPAPSRRWVPGARTIASVLEAARDGGATAQPARGRGWRCPGRRTAGGHPTESRQRRGAGRAARGRRDPPHRAGVAAGPGLRRSASRRPTATTGWVVVVCRQGYSSSLAAASLRRGRVCTGPRTWPAGSRPGSQTACPPSPGPRTCAPDLSLPGRPAPTGLAAAVLRRRPPRLAVARPPAAGHSTRCAAQCGQSRGRSVGRPNAEPRSTEWVGRAATAGRRTRGPAPGRRGRESAGLSRRPPSACSASRRARRSRCGTTV